MNAALKVTDGDVDAALEYLNKKQLPPFLMKLLAKSDTSSSAAAASHPTADDDGL